MVRDRATVACALRAWGARLRGAGEEAAVAEDVEFAEEFGALDVGSAAGAFEEGDEPSAETLAELAAVVEAEALASEVMGVELEAAREALAAERSALREAVERYRGVLLAASPEVPAELVSGVTFDEVDASFVVAREALARIRTEVALSLEREGFPVGAPARDDVSGVEGMSAAEKIAYGLQLQGR